MADIDLRQLSKLFDRKLLPVQRQLDENKRGQAHTNRSLDTVAVHLARIETELSEVKSDVKQVKTIQSDQGEQLTRIERNLTKHDDRLEVLEAKTAHLPDPRPRP